MDIRTYQVRDSCNEMSIGRRTLYGIPAPSLMAARLATDLEPEDEEELLLIVAGLGLTQTNEDGSTEYWIRERSECMECLNDMQRYLRRDDQLKMGCHRALGAWKVLQARVSVEWAGQFACSLARSGGSERGEVVGCECGGYM